MSYCSLSDLTARAGDAEILQVADRDLDGVADAAVIAAAIDQAGTLIDAYLSTRYQMPLAPVPAIVTGWAVSIARYVLHRDGAPDYVVRDYRDAVGALKDAQGGRLAVPSATGVLPVAAGSGAGIGISSGQARFSDAALAGFTGRGGDD